VACHRGEAHLLQQRAELVRFRGGVLDELDAVDAERVGRLRQAFREGHCRKLSTLLN
jgi:hypothetical protein